jgi:hypothetical protein
MIRPAAGVVFTTAADGDMRRDPEARAAVGVVGEWATVHQVHGDTVLEVDRPGEHGDADALVTSTVGLALAVFTADCLGIVLHGDRRVGVVHAGWRGIDRGVVARAVDGVGVVTDVHIGPHIRSCCFEVGPEVAEKFEPYLATTTTGAVSVDLVAAVRAQLPVQPVVVEACTKCGTDTFSHRRDSTKQRLAAIGWVR